MNRSQVALAAIVAGFSFASAAPAAAQSAPAATTSASPEALALSKVVVEAAFPPARREQMVDKLMLTMMEQMRDSLPIGQVQDAGLKRIFDDYMSTMPQVLRPSTRAFLPRQMDALTQAYARMFSVAELKDIAAFAKSPSGAAYLQRSTDILSDPAIAAVNKQYFAEAQGVTQKAIADLVDKVGAYVKAHPEVEAQLTRPDSK